MKIAFLGDSLDTQYGGIHVYTKELLKALSKIDKRNEYVIIRSKNTNEFPDCEEIVFHYPTFPGYRAWRLFFQLPKIIIQNKVDIVVEPGHFGPFNLPEYIKRITVIHDLTMFLFPQDHLFLSQFLQRKFLPHILRKTNHIITNSKHTARDLQRFFPFSKDKTTATLLGKNKQFKPNLKVEGILKKYRITHPYLLCTATLEPRKNIPLLIRAFDDFKTKTGLSHQLVLVGKIGWKAEPILETIKRAKYTNDIEHLGYIATEDLAPLYSAATVFVYPSKYEGFGLPVLEAMACGTPVLTSDVSSLPEVGGDAAQYFSPNSEKELSQKMVSLCTDADLRAQCKKKSLAQAARFSWERTAMETLAVFEKLKLQIK